MAVWVVRQDAPKWGAWDKIALENGVVVIDFGLETDISNFRDRRAVEDYLRQNAHALYGYRSGPPRRVRRAAGQVWRFYKCIAPGDIAVYHVWGRTKDGFEWASFWKVAPIKRSSQITAKVGDQNNQIPSYFRFVQCSG